MERRYRVFAYTTFHLSGEAEKYSVGEFPDCASAIEACRNLVDDFLAGQGESVLTPEELLARYQESGPDPFIDTDDPDCRFSPAEHARERCAAIRGER